MQYDHCPFAAVVAPLVDRPPVVSAVLDLPIPVCGANRFSYDFAVERQAMKDAEAAEIEALTEVEARRKRAEEREQERERQKKEREARAVERAEKRAEREKQAEALRAISQLRQKSVERDREEEETRRVEEENRRKAIEESRAACKVSMPERRATTEEEKQRIAVRQFMTWTGATEDECMHYLTAYDWDLQKSVSNYYGRE